MRKLIVLLVITFGVFACSGVLAPDPVHKAFMEKFKNAANVEWEHEDNNWEAEFDLDGKHMEAEFDASGMWLETEWEIDLTDLPENAMSSIKEVLKLSPDYVEIDVGITNDDQIILHHDSTLERTTNGRGWIRDKTLEVIRELKLKDLEGKITSESIPTLEEVMEIMRKQNINLQIDAKYYDSDIFAQNLVQGIERNNTEKTIITSTNFKFLKKIRKLDADIRLGYDPQDMYNAKLINNLRNMYKIYTDFRPITFEEMREEFEIS